MPVSAKKAQENGFYTVGTSYFHLQKGTFIPDEAENVFYEEPEETVTANDDLASRMIDQENAVDNEGETTSDDQILDAKGNTLLTTSDSTVRANTNKVKGK